MKKSKIVTLVLLSAALNACKNKQDDWQSANNGNNSNKKVYMRSDSSAPYTETRTVHHYHSSPIFWYYAFRPYSTYNPTTRSYQRSGFYSSGVSPQSNVGTNSFKSRVSRGGFGSTFRSSTSSHSTSGFGRSSSSSGGRSSSSSGGHSSGHSSGS
jgi:hypothetical protein